MGAYGRATRRCLTVVQCHTAGGGADHDVAVAGSGAHIGLPGVGHDGGCSPDADFADGNFHIVDHKGVALKDMDAAPGGAGAQRGCRGLDMIRRQTDARSGNHPKTIGPDIHIMIPAVKDAAGCRRHRGVTRGQQTAKGHMLRRQQADVAGARIEQTLVSHADRAGPGFHVDGPCAPAHNSGGAGEAHIARG